MNKINNSKKDIVKFILFLVIIITAVLLSYKFDMHHKFSVDDTKNVITSMGVWAPVIYMISYAFTSLIFFPAALLSTASGAIWGVWLGTVYTVIGATISAFLPFLISRYLGRHIAEKMMKKNKMDICDKFISENGFISVLILRLIPIFPWDVVNYGSGLCNIRFRDYLLATFFGIIPGSFTYNLIGSSVGGEFDWKKVAIAFAVVIIFSISTLIIKKKMEKQSIEKR